MTNPLTPVGIEPATFRFVAQHLNHCAAAVPPRQYIHSQNKHFQNTRTLKSNLTANRPQYAHLFWMSLYCETTNFYTHTTSTQLFYEFLLF